MTYHNFLSFYSCEMIENKFIPVIAYFIVALNSHSVMILPFFPHSLEVNKAYKSSLLKNRTVLCPEAFRLKENLLPVTKRWPQRLHPWMLHNHLLSESFNISLMHDCVCYRRTVIIKHRLWLCEWTVAIETTI